MYTLQELYHSDFKTKLRIARQLYEERGEGLLALPQINKGLIILQQQAEEVDRLMRDLDFGALCSKCALKEGGGCCSLYMADENDAVLLLMNLLAGQSLEIVTDDGFECYLLGQRGCLLRFKPMFCLNYNCKAIQTISNEEGLSSYLAASAKLLQGQWHLETIILSNLS